MIFLYVLQTDELLYSPQGRMVLLFSMVVPMLLSLLLWLIFGDFFHRHSGKSALVIAVLCVLVHQLQPLHFSEAARPREGVVVFVVAVVAVWAILDEKVCSPQLRRLRRWLGELARSLFAGFF